jgi:hypothetical protein
MLLLVLTGIGIYYFAETFTYHKPLFESTGGPEIFPRVILVLLFLFIAVRAIQIILNKKKSSFVFFDLFTGSRGMFLYCFMGYILIMKPLGYIFATFLYLAGLSNYMIYYKDGTIGTARAISIRIVIFAIISVLLYQFFAGILNVNIPLGLLALFQ